ncbi:sigma-70 family RNA polymerase sigma factor [Thalassotalea agarivorans]|uniref:RNA polymerase sigma-70 factor, ECF subfamily n=1 Tax=Thalassotalea agarivorans TaxID=349064 RepID=A0A1H9Y4A1_THASX|nr:sigma-70 family RNA polymerase sigma factor [Thalassotalea agarivorans]SES63698.1 RNA polymerase sigma-70 factor, ECF subfamily [Thalassotalea agarivorans]
MSVATIKELQSPVFKAKNLSMKGNEQQQLSGWILSVAEYRDAGAFKQIFLWFAPKIRAVAFKQLNNEAQAHDILQETMSNVWRKAHLYYPEKGNATTWVYTIMRNVIFDYLRKLRSQNEQQLSDDLWPMVEKPVDDSVLFKDHLLSEKVERHLSSLPEGQKQVVIGFYFQDLTQEQLAQQLDVPLGTVKSRLRLALGKLKHLLGDQHD